MKSVALGVIGAALVLMLLVAFVWLHDIWSDRKHSVQVKVETPVFAGNGNEDCEGKRLTSAQPGTTLQFRRIRYWKNCATVDVALPNGLSGHIVLGEGGVSLTPPLQ
jgi:hypothetical protein